jgi:Uma2 family endonuclease
MGTDTDTSTDKSAVGARQERGRLLARDKRIKLVGGSTWLVPSLQSSRCRAVRGLAGFWTTPTGEWTLRTCDDEISGICTGALLAKAPVMLPGYIHRMNAAKHEFPPGLLDERRRTGCDRLDEVWAGVPHLVPPPSITHQDFEYELEQALRAIAARRGLRTLHNIAVPGSGWTDYRVPDLCVAHPAQLSEHALEGRAELVVEILSPRDESRDKLPFYASRGVREAWLVDPVTRQVEVFALRGRSDERVLAIDGAVHAPALAIELRVVAGPRLQLVDGAFTAEV